LSRITSWLKGHVGRSGEPIVVIGTAAAGASDSQVRLERCTVAAETLLGVGPVVRVSVVVEACGLSGSAIAEAGTCPKESAHITQIRRVSSGRTCCWSSSDPGDRDVTPSEHVVGEYQR
jgi:hypothetical protein